MHFAARMRQLESGLPLTECLCTINIVNICFPLCSKCCRYMSLIVLLIQDTGNVLYHNVYLFFMVLRHWKENMIVTVKLKITWWIFNCVVAVYMSLCLKEVWQSETILTSTFLDPTSDKEQKLSLDTGWRHWMYDFNINSKM